MNTDQFSELPDAIIHKILNLLWPKDVARTTVFSKRWKELWNSLHAFEYDQKHIQAGSGGNLRFINSVENSLAARLRPLTFIQKFKLNITSLDDHLSSRMNSWLRTAIDKDVRDLEIHVKVKEKRLYNLPEFVLKAESVTSLKLHGCRLSILLDKNLPNIRVLSIKKAYIDVDFVNSIIASCTLIEDLRFVFCKGLKSLKITTLLKLKTIEMHECKGLELIEIKLPNLESFWFHANRSKGEIKINLEGCDNLKTLTLKHTLMTDEIFEALISKFPILEKLVLKECNELQMISMFTRKLKVLVLLRCQSLREAVIDASNLYSFEYTGNLMPVSKLNVPSLFEAKISFESIENRPTKISRDALSFLANLLAKGLKLVVFNNENMYVYEELGKLAIADFTNLKLEITKSCLQLKERFGSMLRDSFPKKLYVFSSPNGEFLKFVKAVLEGGEEANLSCCRYYKRKCWRHYLKHVRPLEFDNDLFACLSLELSTERTTIFKFEWKPTKEA